jgi:hypothetical protein
VAGSPQPAAAKTLPSGSCSPLGIVNVVGQVYSPAVAEQARQASGARALRIARDAAAATTDGDRLTLEVNANDTIVDARCG